MNPVTKTFTAELISHGSWGHRDLGKHESTMILGIVEAQGFIEWDIPSLNQTENIGLRLEWNGTGWALTDYDGIMALPKEVVQMLRENGIYVAEEFENGIYVAEEFE